MGSGTILREVMAAQELLEADWGVASDLWSVTSFTELRRNGLDAERHNMLHPDEKKPQVAYVTEQLAKTEGPIIASTDYMKLFADQIRPFVPKGREYKVLGTDGFGRSDFRSKLREHFEVDHHFVVVAALRATKASCRSPRWPRPSKVRHQSEQNQPAIRLRVKRHEQHRADQGSGHR